MQINATRIAESIELLRQYFDEDDIAPLLAVLEKMIEDPQDAALLEQLAETFNGLGFTQGAVLTYAPYIAVILSGNPLNTPD